MTNPSTIQIAELTAEIASLRSQVVRLENLTSDQRETILSLNEKRAIEAKKLEEATSQYDAIALAVAKHSKDTAYIAELTAQNGALNAEIFKLGRKYDEALTVAAEEKDKHEVTKGMLKAENEGRLADQQRIRDLVESNGNALEEHDRLNDIINEQKVELEGLRRVPDGMADLTRRISEKDGIIGVLRGDLEDEKNNVFACESTIAALRKGTASRDEEIVLLKKEIARQNEECNQVNRIVHDLRVAARAHNAEVAELQDIIAAKTGVINVRDKELKELRELRAMDLARLDTSRRDISEAAKREADLRKNTKQLEANLWELKTTVERLEKDNKLFVEKNIELATKVNTIESETQRKNELAKIYGRLNAIENKLENL